MNSRNIIAILSALVCFGLLPRVQATPENDPDGPNPPAKPNLPVMAPAPETPDPGAVAGSLNTADGDHALFNVTTGIGNAAFGWFSLLSNTDGSFNTAVGAGTLVLNIGDQTTGDGVENTAVGTVALLFNSTGARNTAVGSTALEINDTGTGNTAMGHQALRGNIDGSSNTAVGRVALPIHQTGNFNTAIGNQSMQDNTSGVGNTAIGSIALSGVDTGDNNTGLGRGAGSAIGSGSGNVCIGQGVNGVAGEDNTTRIRNIYETVQPVVGTDPDLVTISSTGRLGRSNVSSRRYKHDIQPMDKASEVIYALKPVSFRYNKEYDATQTLAYGLIAEEVAEVYPDLVGRNPKGQPESVRYEQINAMLLNEFLKEHKKVKDLEATVAQQQKGMEVLTAQLKEQAAQIQKVNAQLEVNKPATQVVLNNP
jgi:Chaperone of endosialidase